MAAPLVERTVVINLARRADRLTSFAASYAASGWSEVLGDVQVVPAVDGLSGERPGGPLAVQPGVYGCWASHVQVLQDALHDGVQTLAVFEDDAVLQPDSAAWLRRLLQELPSDAIGLWLDATLLGEDNRLMLGTFGTARLSHPPLRTHAYVLGRPLIEQLAAAVAVTPGHIDRQYAHAWIRGGVYGAVPSLAAQSDSPSDTLSDWRRLYEVQRSNSSRWLRLEASRM